MVDVLRWLIVETFRSLPVFLGYFIGRWAQRSDLRITSKEAKTLGRARRQHGGTLAVVSGLPVAAGSSTHPGETGEGSKA